MNMLVKGFLIMRYKGYGWDGTIEKDMVVFDGEIAIQKTDIIIPYHSIQSIMPSEFKGFYEYRVHGMTQILYRKGLVR